MSSLVMPNVSIPPLKRNSRDNERPLVEDIRLLGRILGDVIREEEGAEIYTRSIVGSVRCV